MSDDQQLTLDAVNQALKDLGDRFAAGEVTRADYRRLRRQLVAEVSGEDPDTDDGPPTGRHPPIKTQTDRRLRFWMVPLLLAVMGLGGVLALIWFLWR